MNKKIRFFLFMVFLLVILVFFGSGIDKEMVYRPVWTIDWESGPIRQDEGALLLPYVRDDILGYFDSEGGIYYREKILHGAAVHSTGFINYSRLSDTLVFRNTGGEIVESLDLRGYPFFIKDRLLVFSGNGRRIGEYTLRGEEIWSRSFGSLITSLAEGEGCLFVGLINGSLVLLSDEGKEIYTTQPVGSRIQAIYGCAMTPGAEKLAVVSGLDPQTLLFFERRNDTYKMEEMFRFPEPVRHSVFMAFSEDGRYLVTASDSRTFLYSFEEGALRDFGKGEMLKGVSLEAEGSLSVFLMERKEDHRCIVMDLEGSFRDDIAFPEELNFLMRNENTLFTGFGKKLVRVDLEAR
ncbi:MAG: hypothetical protein JW760_14170 [Spirochaetales bacterium]|nr:hypothetical protein [Spirochaetales bacterium]